MAHTNQPETFADQVRAIPGGECLEMCYSCGTYVSSCKISLLNTMLGQMGVGDGRVRFAQIGTQDRGRIRSEVDGMLEHLSRTLEAAMVTTAEMAGQEV